MRSTSILSFSITKSYKLIDCRAIISSWCCPNNNSSLCCYSRIPLCWVRWISKWPSIFNECNRSYPWIFVFRTWIAGVNWYAPTTAVWRWIINRHFFKVFNKLNNQRYMKHRSQSWSYNHEPCKSEKVAQDIPELVFCIRLDKSWRYHSW